MAQNTAIEWAHDSKNYWQGCVEISGHPACAFCYARRDLERYGHQVWGKDADRKFVKSSFSDVRRFQKIAAQAGERRRVFINSQSDFFEDHTGRVSYAVQMMRPKRTGYVDVILEDGKPRPLAIGETDQGRPLCCVNDLRSLAFRQFDECPDLDILLLTKRPELIHPMWPDRLNYFSAHSTGDPRSRSSVYRDNVWIGTSISNQKTAVKFAGALNNIPIGRYEGIARLRYLSVEPFLGPIGIDWQPFAWVIIGCESKPGGAIGRLGFDTEQAWHEAAGQLCSDITSAGSLPFVKQIPINGRVSHDMSEWPEYLRHREVPRVPLVPQAV